MTAPLVDPLFTVPEVAKVLKTGRDYVYDRMNDGALPYVELGGARSMRRVKASVLKAFVDARESEAVAS